LSAVYESGYDLSTVSVLLVEDNDFIRSVLMNVLLALKVGRVVKCRDGKEAIEFLKTFRLSPEKAGVSSVDIILSDMLMSPIDGLNLLRWVRQSRESPDRFVPFIMISGFVDRDSLAKARDMGVTEFLAKPFSVKSVAEKIESVIERPRPFIRAESYFGPDRRRRADSNYKGAERRRPVDEAIEVVYE
jgi:two-component system, chemotaxis family, chemotaxis protein CheY